MLGLEVNRRRHQFQVSDMTNMKVVSKLLFTGQAVPIYPQNKRHDVDKRPLAITRAAVLLTATLLSDFVLRKTKKPANSLRFWCIFHLFVWLRVWRGPWHLPSKNVGEMCIGGKKPWRRGALDTDLLANARGPLSQVPCADLYMAVTSGAL